MACNPIMQRIMESPLYEKIELDKDGSDSLYDYFCGRDFNELTVDLYCPQCKSNSIFNPTHEKQIECDTPETEPQRFFRHSINFGILHYRCARDRNHYFCAQIIYEENEQNTNGSIIKIGQFPSKADIEFPEYNRFSKILPKEKLSDLKKSAGLASHGIGAGSFVYLRRIFEYLLNDAYQEALYKKTITEESYENAHVVDRIKMLKPYLPEIMVENCQTYGILSKGVHELDEQTCLNAYSLMKETIEAILDEKLVKKEKEERQKRINIEINKLGSNLK